MTLFFVHSMHKRHVVYGTDEPHTIMFSRNNLERAREGRTPAQKESLLVLHLNSCFILQIFGYGYDYRSSIFGSYMYS